MKSSHLIAFVVALAAVLILFHLFDRSTNTPLADIAMLLNGDQPALSGVFSIRIESNKPVYRMGERIELRTTLIGNTPRNYAAFGGPPYLLSDLIVFDGRRRQLLSSGKRCCATWSSANMLEFRGEKTIILQYNDPENEDSVSEWADIKYWAYDLNRPGDYSVTAVPTFRAFERGDDLRSVGPQFAASRADTSNTLHIAILAVAALPTPSPPAHDRRSDRPTSMLGSPYRWVSTRSGYRLVTMTCAHPNALPQCVSGSRPHLPVGLTFKGTVIVQVDVAPNGSAIRSRIWKTSGNAQIDQSVLDAAQHSRYSPMLLYCQPVEGEYLFRADFPPQLP
jgi:TonB family protein